MTDAITVIKTDHAGREVWRYEGRLLGRGPTWVLLEARFNRPDVDAGYHVFRQGDRFVEQFFSDRWYSIFEMHDIDDDRLTGWYCNLSRPARFRDPEIEADGLALDLYVAPDGPATLLDGDEFAALPLDEGERAQVRRAVDDLLARVEGWQPPFDAILG